ncbi:MAG: NYN domain-containing protein [Anaerolineales bacterium]|nr:NYN domain-containing protein [Anaerolineales bacterium]
MPPSSALPPDPYGRVALFIDGSNFYHTVRDLGIPIDYRRLRQYSATRGKLVRANYYTALLETGTPDWLYHLTDGLAYSGYRVVTKPARSYRQHIEDEEGIKQWITETKGNVDIEIAVDMLTLAPYCATLVLFSGDGDFLSVIEAVQHQGCRMGVISSERTSARAI